MSTRLGMGDGRFLTSYDSSNLVNDYIMMKNGIAYQDNFKYRMYLQNNGVQGVMLPLRNAACGDPVPFGSDA
jgi:hypothetical protein